MAYGFCDVEQCRRETYVDWRPLTERIGRQVCKNHWDRHKNKNDRFNLFDTFSFRKPPDAKPETQSQRCACGEELQPGHRLCKECAAERERQRKKEYYHRKKIDKPHGQLEEIILRCKDCGGQRLLGHSYCRKCGQWRSQKSNRERQRRHYKKNTVCKTVNPNAFDLQKSPFLRPKTRKKFSESGGYGIYDRFLQKRSKTLGYKE